MTDKQHREDNALDARPGSQRGGREPGEDGTASNKKPSNLWLGLARGSAREEAVARKGASGGASEVPYREELEESLETDLSGVKAYTGKQAAESADQLGAEAYAMRDDDAIVFGDSNPSKELVAHEVAHMLQHGSGEIGQDEAEADAVGAQLAAGTKVDAAAIKSGGGKVRKKEKTDLSKVFEDWLHGEKPHGSDPSEIETATRADGTDLSSTIAGATNTMRGLADDGTFGSRSETGDVAVSGAGLTVSHEETERIGKTRETKHEVAASIDSAAALIKTERLDNAMERLSTYSRNITLQLELDKLDEADLDPALAAGARSALVTRLAEGNARLAKLEAEEAAYAKLSKAIVAEKAALVSSDPALVALRLADAEETFMGKETTRKKSFGFDVLAGTVKRSVSVETTDSDETGTMTSGASRESSVELGGGLAYTKSGTRSKSRADADGNKHATEVTREDTTKVIAKDDGTVGVGREKKLSGAIENSFGKATGGVGCGGAVTANIIELPHEGAESEYAVIVTINVGLAVEAGGEKTGEVAKGKLAGSLSAKAGAEGELTQTRILDRAGAKSYLDAIDAVSNGGKPSSDKREIEVLYRAVNGLGSVDEILYGAAATLGSSNAAKAMGVDESIELTTKVSAGIDASASYGGAGASGGASGEVYRGMKIGRVAGNPGQELVEITVTFGDSSDIHGALTGAALGVSATYGQKAWDSSNEAVTFRLDSKAEDYAALYDEVVGTMSRNGLIELRKSRRFARHVKSYSSTTATGDETSLDLSGVLGVSDTEARSYESKRGMTDGQLDISETGTQTRSTGFSVGPLELLKRSQQDQAQFEIKDGVSTLDISESTETGALGQFEFSLDDLLTADSPAKAAEKALVKQQRMLEGFFLDPEDLERLAQKAKHDPASWGNVPLHADRPGAIENATAWEDLRRALKSPKLDDDRSIPLETRRELALGGAVARFTSRTTHAKAVEYFRVLLRDWRAGADGDIGTAYEFPADVPVNEYKDVRRRCKGLDLALATYVPDMESGAEDGLAVVTDLQLDLAKILKKVEESYGFSDERNRMEMIAELRALAAEIPKTRRDFLRSCSGDVVTPEMDTGDAVADAKSQVTHLEATIDKSKVSEIWLLDRAQRQYEDNDYGERAEKMEPLINQLLAIYPLHVALVKELRGAYAAAGVETGAWKVSQPGSAERMYNDIWISRFIDLFSAYRKAKPNNMGVWGLAEAVNTYRSKFGRY